MSSKGKKKKNNTKNPKKTAQGNQNESYEFSSKIWNNDMSSIDWENQEMF